ncbi:MAG: exo-alpha-sialidase [Sphingobacteriales bacterium]|nr:MAG: exo-alpha-sialidase [Sphingobacteriales bacterium]
MRNNLVRSVLASSFFATPRRRWRLFAPRHKMSKVMVALAFIVSAIFLTSTAQAQTYKAMPLDGGGWTSGFAQANNGRLYAYGDVFGAWRSDDGGNNWTYLNWDIKPKEVEPKIPGGDVVGMGMAVQKDNADVVYYASFNAFYKSIDGGTTWARYLDDIAWGDQPKEFRRFRGTSQILIRPNNPNEIWFAGPRKNQTGWLWKSINGGVNWVKAGGSNFDSNKARTLHNVATFANQIWVGSDNGLYVSTDGGNNFNLVGNSTSLKDVGMISRFTSGTFAGVGLVTRANNNGGGISRITATNYNDANTYTVSDAATNNLYFGYPTGLQIFSDGSSSAWNTSGDRHGFSPAGDGGQTFTVRATTLNTNPTPIWTTAAIMAGKNHPDFGTDQVIEDVNNPNKWIITGGGAAMYSLDKGFSWQYFPNGVGIAAVKTYLASVSRFDANRVYVPASDIGSVIVTDGGASGQASLSSCKFFTTLHGSHRVMEGPNTQNLVVAGVNQGACASILLKSSDGGTTWNNFNLSGSGLPLSYDGICKTAMSINDSNDFLISLASAATADNQSSVPPNSINPGVWRTTNGGTSFRY